ncbi:MAG: hypothetical protein KGZ51_03920 [Erysipelothrix sp.]|jgi:hypothetical protein|nr:hypothetical protein [Erysipelothrix sp.]
MFKITDISNGWFNFSLNNGTEIFNAICSKVVEIDIAKQLLLLAHDLLCKKSHQVYFCINSENEAYQMKVNRTENKIEIIIREIIMNPIKLIGSTQTSIEAAKVGDPIFILEILESTLIENVYFEYSKLDKIEYEKNWFSFPDSILSDLKKILNC